MGILMAAIHPKMRMRYLLQLIDSSHFFNGLMIYWHLLFVCLSAESICASKSVFRRKLNQWSCSSTCKHQSWLHAWMQARHRLTKINQWCSTNKSLLKKHIIGRSLALMAIHSNYCWCFDCTLLLYVFGPLIKDSNSKSLEYCLFGIPIK